MAKRRDDSDSLPLFDLPLHEDPAGEEPTPPGRPGGGPTSLGGSPSSPLTATRREALELADSENDDLAPEVDQEAEGVGAHEQGPPALASRLLSGIVDLLAQLAALGTAGAATFALGVTLDRGDLEPFALLGIAFSFLYWVVPLAFWGQTPGMSVCDILARTLEDEPLTFGQTARRWLGAMLTAALVGLPLLVALSGRSLTDRLSGTKTIRLPTN